MLFVERSNRTERLLEGLAARLMVPGRDPLAPSVVVVQGPGMERWLAQSIARRHGVCANLEFLFPRDFLERLFEAIPDQVPAGRNSDWEVGRLVWSVARLLAEGRGEPDFEPLARHLDAPDGDWRLVQLAQQIARLFDRYITFRPDWLRAWNEAPSLPDERDARWQARLLRELRAELGPGHLGDRAQLFLDADAASSASSLDAGLARGFPDVIEIFAVSTLPPLSLSLIDALARRRDVHLSILSPSRSYWADLWREVRDGDLEGAASDASGGPPGLFDAAPATPVARLLAGLGRLGGDFQRCLEDHSMDSGGDIEHFESPLEGRDSPSLLARLQAALLDLEEAPDSGPSGDPARLVRRDDDSIQIHLCHGPRRELEVVEAALREAFERDPTLLPEDVIVMAPRIDEIAPDIEAVFGVPRADGRTIPHRIADRGTFQRSPVAETFRGLLDLLGGRAARSEVLDWLTRPPARERFGLDEEAVERLGEWAERAGIRFGLDEDHRADLELAPERSHTWAAGLERLALAHAVGASAELFAGVAPEPLDPFAEPTVLGSLGELESLLRQARDRIATPSSVPAWCVWLRELLEGSCVQTDSNAHEHTAIRGVLQELSGSASAASFEEPIPYEAIRERVAEALESRPAPQAFLAGGVTFCELVPLRAIPFRVVAILGMSDDAFPRGRPAPGFDLMARSPRPGDRSTRTDDRYLFLEALLSARDRLILSVPGRDVRDGSDLPPSIVVAELLDAVEGSFELEPVCDPEQASSAKAPSSLREQLVVRHPLQSFSPRYFEVSGDRRLRGRDEEAFAGAQARRAAIEAGGGVERRFLETLEPSSDLGRTAGAQDPAVPMLSLDELVERVLRATRYFTRERLRLRLPRTEEVVGDLDPVDLGPLERFALGSALLDDLDAGLSTEEATRRLSSRASLPAGLPGALAARSLRYEVEEVARVAAIHRAGLRLEDLDRVVELEVEGLGASRLIGRLDRCHTDGRIQVGFGRVGRRGELAVWIHHLFLCACVEAGAERVARSVLVGRTEDKKSLEHVVVFGEVEDARVHLARLFEWAWSAADAPLPFFPESSKIFARRALEDKRDQAWREAQQRYHGGDSGGFLRPESEEELEYARLWEGVSPLESTAPLPVHFRFDLLAEQFFAPLQKAREVRRE